MTSEKKPVVERRVPRRRGRRWFLALLSGMSAWIVLGWWLEPRPLWQLRFANDDAAQQAFCEDENGTWLLTSQRKVTANKKGKLESETIAYHILEGSTGKVVSSLDRPEYSLSSSEDFGRIELQSIRIIGQTLWRCVKYKKDNDLHFELRAWHFTRDDKERIVKQWIVPESTPFDINFTSRFSPYFVVTTELPWQPGLATLLTDGWTGMTSMIALGGVTPKSAIIPWVRTYQVQSDQVTEVKLLASWTLPPLRLSTPVLSSTLNWVIFDDTELPGRTWKISGHDYCHPLGLLQFDARTGKLREYFAEQANPSQPSKAEAWGNLLRIQHGAKRSEACLYDGTSARLLAWPNNMPAPSEFYKILTDSLHPNQGVYKESLFKEDKEYQHVQWTESGIEGFRVASSEDIDNLQVMTPAYLQNHVLACYGVNTHQPKPLIWLSKQARWLERGINELWPSHVVGLHFFDVTTGRKVWEIKNVDVHTFAHSNKHIHTAYRSPNVFAFTRGEPTLEAWAISFRIYSAWWSRGAGLLVLIAILMMRRKRQSALAS